MAITYPYSLAAFADLLRYSSVVWDIKRNDLISGQGSGRIWQAEMARPLWMAVMELPLMYSAEAKSIAALIRKLHGSQEMFFISDPLSPFPASDPTGSLLGSASVSVASIGSDNASIALKGLPSGYKLTIGDKLEASFGSSPTRYAFLEVSETVVANGSGVTPEFGVFPHIPVGLVANIAVKLKKPACLMKMMPQSHRPGTAQKHLTDGAGFTAIQAV